jgi:hypothetical protein
MKSGSQVIAVVTRSNAHTVKHWNCGLECRTGGGGALFVILSFDGRHLAFCDFIF